MIDKQTKIEKEHTKNSTGRKIEKGNQNEILDVKTNSQTRFHVKIINKN